jgi:hypothetical protein
MPLLPAPPWALAASGRELAWQEGFAPEALALSQPVQPFGTSQTVDDPGQATEDITQRDR